VTVLGIPDNQFAEAFLDALPSICPLSSIANIIIPHFSPKRLAALAKLIEARCSSGERHLPLGFR
jgi:flavorubredoxin